MQSRNLAVIKQITEVVAITHRHVVTALKNGSEYEMIVFIESSLFNCLHELMHISWVASQLRWGLVTSFLADSTMEKRNHFALKAFLALNFN